jgi:glycosyltransferase involved in cell wall biosynthesis
MSINAVTSQTVGFDKIILVPWGKDSASIERECQSVKNLKIVKPTKGTSLEENRNAAISHLSTVMEDCDYVAFVDDDTILSPNWLEAMKYEAEQYPNCCFSSTTVPFKFDDPNKKYDHVQSCGHYFESFRPLDLNYNVKISDLGNEAKEMIFPCGTVHLFHFHISWKFRNWTVFGIKILHNGKHASHSE